MAGGSHPQVGIDSLAYVSTIRAFAIPTPTGVDGRGERGPIEQ
jgi:hypothetical protein